MPWAVGIVAVLIAGSDHQHPEAQDLGDAMHNTSCRAPQRRLDLRAEARDAEGMLAGFATSTWKILRQPALAGAAR
jgi:hypothetical protein